MSTLSVRKPLTFSSRSLINMFKSPLTETCAVKDVPLVGSFKFIRSSKHCVSLCYTVTRSSSLQHFLTSIKKDSPSTSCPPHTHTHTVLVSLLRDPCERHQEAGIFQAEVGGGRGELRMSRPCSPPPLLNLQGIPRKVTASPCSLWPLLPSGPPQFLRSQTTTERSYHRAPTSPG